MSPSSSGLDTHPCRPAASWRTLGCSLQPQQTSQQRPADACPANSWQLPLREQHPAAAQHCSLWTSPCLCFCLSLILILPSSNIFVLILNQWGPIQESSLSFITKNKRAYLYHHNHTAYNGWEAENKTTFCKLTSLCIFPHRMHKAVLIKHMRTNRTTWNNTVPLEREYGTTWTLNFHTDDRPAKAD